VQGKVILNSEVKELPITCHLVDHNKPFYPAVQILGYSTCYIPMYCGMTFVPETFAVGNGDRLTYSGTSAFWTFNLVANLAYIRYDSMIEDVQKEHERERRLI
jgi:dipeptidase